MTREAVLIIRLAGIGDVVMASTVARRVRQERPNARIVWLCGTTAAPLVERFEDVDEVIAIDERRLLRGGVIDRIAVLLPLWTRLVRERFAHVFLLHVDARYRVLTLPLVGARVVSQSRRDDFGAMNPVPGRYFGDEYARLVDGLAHHGPIVGHYALATLKNAATPPVRAGSLPRVAMVPGGTRNVLRESILKRWPVQHYAALARALATDCEIVLVGDSADAWVLEHFEGIDVTSHIGRVSLPETVDRLAGCDLVISHDTGPMHLARLAGAPLLALFGPTMPSQFVVEDERTTVLFGGAHLACRPCYDGREFADCSNNVCMSSIAVDLVHRTALEMLGLAIRTLPSIPAPARAPLPIRP